jgi:hypothetical protein
MSYGMLRSMSLGMSQEVCLKVCLKGCLGNVLEVDVLVCLKVLS